MFDARLYLHGDYFLTSPGGLPAPPRPGSAAAAAAASAAAQSTGGGGGPPDSHHQQQAAVVVDGAYGAPLNVADVITLSRQWGVFVPQHLCPGTVLDVLFPALGVNVTAVVEQLHCTRKFAYTLRIVRPAAYVTCTRTLHARTHTRT